jgi:hypothetical protein
VFAHQARDSSLLSGSARARSRPRSFLTV